MTRRVRSARLQPSPSSAYLSKIKKRTFCDIFSPRLIRYSVGRSEEVKMDLLASCSGLSVVLSHFSRKSLIALIGSGDSKLCSASTTKFGR